MVSETNLQLIVAASQALFSLGLLVVTAVYTFYTRKQSNATKNQIAAVQSQTSAIESQTKTSAKPHIKATIERPNPVVCNFAIQNTGNGAAHNVSASWVIGSDDRERNWTIPLLASGDKHQFHLTHPNNDKILPTEKDIKECYEGYGFELRFESTCEDIFEESHTFEETIDLEEAIWGREKGTSELIGKQSDETIAEGVESISKNFDDIGNVATYLSRELPSIVNARQDVRILEILDNYGEMSIEQLSSLSPEDTHIVSMKVESLVDDGLLDHNVEKDNVQLSDGN